MFAAYEVQYFLMQSSIVQSGDSLVSELGSRQTYSCLQSTFLLFLILSLPSSQDATSGTAAQNIWVAGSSPKTLRVVSKRPGPEPLKLLF